MGEFERRCVRRVADQDVGGGQGFDVHGPGPGDAEPLPAHSSRILQGDERGRRQREQMRSGHVI